MHSTTTEIEMTTEIANLETLTRAAIRLDDAERDLRIAEIHLNSLILGAPLRSGVEATRRVRAADADLEAARVTYAAAQDLAAPED